MYAKFCVNRETASNFMRLFVNRRAYAIQGERPLPNGSVPYYPARDWKTKEPKPLDDGVVRMHLNGDVTISLYAINPDTQRSKWVAMDADFDGALESLFKLQWELKQDGVEAALEQSRRGGHLWIFGAEPVEGIMDFQQAGLLGYSVYFVVELHSKLRTAFLGIAGAGVVNQHLTHGARGNSQEMGSIRKGGRCPAE